MGKDVEDQTSISSEGESFTEKERTPSVPPAPPHGEEENTEMVQEVMRDNLDIMLDIILRIRAEPGFAKSIYADCPRLQVRVDRRLRGVLLRTSDLFLRELAREKGGDFASSCSLVSVRSR
jgi:hypothetical protein